MNENAPPASPVGVDVSVVVLTHNTRELTRACLRSVLADASSSQLGVETIVVDNASTDGTVEMLRRDFPEATLISNESNLGYARGNNAGLDVARGRYLLVLNSDAELHPGALEALARFMDGHADAGACGPMLLNADGSLQPSGRALPSVWSVFLGMSRVYRLWKRDFYREPGRDYRRAARVGEVSGAAILVRREAFQRAGGLDPEFYAYYEDVDWCKRIGEAGYGIYYVPDARATHHWGGTSRVVSAAAYRAGQDSLRYYFAKHHGRLAHALIQVLLAGRECLYVAAAWARRDRQARQFHAAMLAAAFSRLEASKRRAPRG